MFEAIILNKNQNDAHPTGSQKGNVTTYIPLQYLLNLLLDALQLHNVENNILLISKYSHQDYDISSRLCIIAFPNI